MKLSAFSAATVLALSIFTSAQALDETSGPNADTNRRNLKGYQEREANAQISRAQTISELLTNPDGLFKRLDHDNNGQLSQEEFERIVNAGVQGASATQGTQGVSATGASSATGVTGTTSVAGQTTVPGQAPATYGQQPGVTGQAPAPGQPATNTPRDAATAGQQSSPAPAAPTSAQPAAPNGAPDQNLKPAPGQQPSPSGASTAPSSQDPQ